MRVSFDGDCPINILFRFLWP